MRHKPFYFSSYSPMGETYEIVSGQDGLKHEVLNGHIIPDGKVDVANMGHSWVLSAPGGPRVGPMNLAIRVRKK